MVAKRSLSPGRRWAEVITVGMVVVVGATLAALVLDHAPGMNGPAYWQWPWQTQAWDRDEALLLYAPALAAFVAAQLAGRTRAWLGLLLLCVTAALLIHAAQEILSPEPALDRAAAVLEHRNAHGYYRDALHLAEEEEGWLARFPELMPQLHLHPRTKGPGIILLYQALLSLMEPSRALTRAAATLLGFLSVLAIPAIFAMARALGVSRNGAFASASLFALAPSLGVFWPSFDAVYPVMTCLQVITWHRALTTDRARDSIAFGLLVGLGWLFAYNLLVLGAFLFVHAVIWSRTWPPLRGASWPRSLARPAKHALIVALTITCFYAALHALTGFDPIATFRSALEIQEGLLGVIPRPYPDTALFDLTDLALGIAWLPLIPAVIGTFAALTRRRRDDGLLMATCLLQPVLIAVLALLPGETARVMLFMAPFFLLPAGMAVSRWHPASRAILYAATFALSIVISRSMIFVAI